MTESEQASAKERRLQWFREARFGMFIHWGLYAVPAGTWKGQQIPSIGEWIMNRAKIPVGEYEKLAEQFNPVRFNADEWVSLAKSAGMRYIVITAKHHDGFAMYHSQVSDYDIVDATPFGRDPMAELAEACRRQGLRLCFYYSHCQDWHHPDGAGNTWDYDPAKQDFARYFEELAKPQVRELLTRYGPIGLIWFDTPQRITPEQSRELADLVHELQPDCLVNGRIGHGAGDYGQMGDNRIPGSVVPGDWETPATVNDTWGYKSYDDNWKPVEVLVGNLVDIVSKGGNYLLNVGPTAEGIIPEPSAERLRAVGEWLRGNGEAIYGAGPTPFRRLPYRCTTKPGKLYVHLFDWPGERLALPGLQNPVVAARMLRAPEGQMLGVTREDGTVSVRLPQGPTDPIDSIVVVEIEGAPVVEATPLKQAEDGSLELGALDAEVQGSQARYESDKDCVGFWTDRDEYVTWPAQISRPGVFEVEVTLGHAGSSQDNLYVLSVGDQELTGTVPTTGSWTDFTTVKLGRIEVREAGVVTVQVRPAGKARGPAMNLRQVKLTPAR